MSKMGMKSDKQNFIVKQIKMIKHSYVYRIISKVFSVTCTVLLVLLLVFGGMMFYFNLQAKKAKQQGVNYTAPFGLYTIISGSMEPKIHVADVVLVIEEKDLSRLKVGDIITFVSTWNVNYGDTVTHRIVAVNKNEKGEYFFNTKGDANKDMDGSTVVANNLIGKVHFRIPKLGHLQFFLATRKGWFIIVFIPAMLIIIFDLIKIFRLYILRSQLNNIVDTGETKTTYFETEKLEDRNLTEDELMVTNKINTVKTDSSDLPILNKVEPTNDEEELVRKPIKKTRKRKNSK